MQINLLLAQTDGRRLAGGVEADECGEVVEEGMYITDDMIDKYLYYLLCIAFQAKMITQMNYI